MNYNSAVTVTDLNKYIKDKIDNDENLNSVLVKGEISNFKNHYTGHLYFTLKDKSSAVNLKFMPKDGMKVIIYGTVSVFERDGVYQIYCKMMQEDGMGSLHIAFEELKSKLGEEGLFSEEHKKKIPVMPKCIGVLTSNTGSVIRDIINVSTRRNPNVYIKLLPVPVQGEGAAVKIAEAIKIMNEKKLADVIIVARGGGSLEDLWPFNEEIVARAIYESELPILSAVGHETDFTIADFVADLRAPTPSAAAELAVPNISDVLLKLKSYNNRYRLALKKKVDFMKLSYEKCMNRRAFREPLQTINESYILLDILIHCFCFVTPGLFPTIADVFLEILFINEDFPTLGIPRIITLMFLPILPFCVATFKSSSITLFISLDTCSIPLPEFESTRIVGIPLFL